MSRGVQTFEWYCIYMGDVLTLPREHGEMLSAILTGERLHITGPTSASTTRPQPTTIH